MLYKKDSTMIVLPERRENDMCAQTQFRRAQFTWCQPASMDEQRKLLDQLMGTGRNGEGGGAKHFSDRDVCRYYLVGLCPHDLFGNTVRLYALLGVMSLTANAPIESRPGAMSQATF